jgi:hypothetical protein
MITKLVHLEMGEIDSDDNNADELHTTLHPEIKFTLNSINVSVGQTGSGKSRNIFRIVSMLKYIRNPYHLLVHVTDEENDKTFSKYKDLLEVPILQVKYEEAYETLQGIAKSKNMYEAIRNGEVNDATEEEKKELLEYLLVKDFKIPVLHTLVLFDDATDLFSGPKNPLNDLIVRNRHHKFTYFFNIHNFTKALPMNIKKNMRSLWYFGGYSRQDFVISFQQMKSPIDKERLYDIYKNLGKRDALFFDYTDDGTKVEVINLG